MRARVEAIYQTIVREYVLRYSNLAREKTMAVVELGQKYSAQYTLPLYIHIKAVLLVSK